MQRKNLGDMPCPIARSLERVGEWWSILILRDAFYGLTRFDEFQKSLAIAPNILTRRLNALVEAGLLRRRRYSNRPPRYEYVLTERGRDFRPVMQAMLAWGNRHFAPEGPSVVITNRETGETADPVLIDRISGLPMNDAVFRTVPGPAANERVLKKLAAANRALESAVPAAPAPVGSQRSPSPARSPARSGPHRRAGA
jgi:DNA-binding HxlR family transcriptional regulator